MEKRKNLPIGNDEFIEIRENNHYYVDKSLLIKDFLEMNDKVALIARPRRFGKTLNMTMIREFFDITKDSWAIFDGLAIMGTQYAGQINSRPVIYLTFKNCRARTAKELLEQIKNELYKEYKRYGKQILGNLEPDSYEFDDFQSMVNVLRTRASESVYFEPGLQYLTQCVKEYYEMAPILLIDEYDQPIMSSYEHGYHDELGDFFSNFYGSAMKGNPALGQALITGVQRVAKESIFSQFNNPQVYTVLDQEYAPYFGLNESETRELLRYYGLELSEDVRRMYDGYQIGGNDIYNPWSIINYAKRGILDNYWVKTSANFLVKKGIQSADANFWDKFEKLVVGKSVAVWITLDTSFAERASLYSLWGLLVNAGYLTVMERIDAQTAVIRIPNGEVMAEFELLLAEMSGVDGLDLKQMFSCLLRKDMGGFFDLYKKIVISCTSYMDAKENAYHMLLLGMSITLRGAYKVTSNLESGYGRSDITLEALNPANSHVIIEFKQGEDLERLKEDALKQILDNF